MKQFGSFLLVLLAFGFASAASAQEAEPKLLGKFGYWAAYHMVEGSENVCYMTITAKPPQKKGSKVKRADVVLMISHRPAEGATDVVSYQAGAKFKSSSDAIFKIAGKEYNLFTQGDTAWARDPASDHIITAALRKASSLTVTAKAANGTAIADSVNLKGVADAYYEIGKACGLAVEKPKAEKKAPKKETAAKPKTTDQKR